MKRNRINVIAVHSSSVLFAYFLLCICAHAQAQVKRGDWRYISLPVDSVKSVLQLSFSDSLHGYVGVQRMTPFLDTILGVAFNLNQRWYRTTDGGRSWEQMSFGSLYPDVFVARTSYSGIGNNMTFWPLLFTPIDGGVVCVPMNSGWGVGTSIIGSEDYGSTWQPRLNGYNTSGCVLVDALDSKRLLMYDPNVSHHALYYSNDGGVTLPSAPTDSIFLRSVYPYDITGRARVHVTGACIDSTHWIIALQPGESRADTLFASGLNIVMSSDAGRSWHFVNHLPKDYQPTFVGDGLGGHDFPGKFQIARTTKEVYFMTGEYCEGEQEYQFARMNHRPGTYCLCGNTSGSLQGISFLYSSDYGASWSENRTFGTRRRAFEAVGNGNVWMTAVEEDSIRDEYRASLMLHSTNNGVTWDTDRYALSVSDYALLDGRILTFTDPDHGWCAAIENNGILRGGLVMMRYEPRVLSSVAVVQSRAMQTFNFCQIYPNPASDNASFLMPVERKLYGVELYDMFGRKPRYTYQQIDRHSAEIDTHLVPTGLYIARINYDVGWFTENLVIVH